MKFLNITNVKEIKVKLLAYLLSDKKLRKAVEDHSIILNAKKLNYKQDQLYTYTNSDFMSDPVFIESYNLGKQTDTYQFLKGNDFHWRVYVACWAADYAKKLEGDFVECGVHTGIISKSIVHYINFKNLDKKFYLLDTFSGLDPKYSSSEELEKSKKFGYKERSDLYARVKETFKEYNVKIIKGSVPSTLPQVKANKICYLSIDMNSVIPEIEALEYFWDKLIKGGIVILDDYGFVNHKEQKKAHDTFAKSKKTKVLSIPTGQGIIIKH